MNTKNDPNLIMGDQIEKRNLALLLIDIQNGWFTESQGLIQSLSEKKELLSKVVNEFRVSGHPVIFVCFQKTARNLMPGYKEYEVVDGIGHMESDICVVKTRMNSFSGTDLPDILEKNGCDGVLIVGLSALHCVISTYFGAFDHYIDSYILRGGAMGPNEESEELLYKVCKTVSFDRVVKHLRENDQLRPDPLNTDM